MDPNASTAANQPRMEIGTDAPAGDRAQATANQPTGRQATGLPPGAPIPPPSGASGRSTSGSQQHSGPPRTKLALLTWVGAYAVILVVLTVGGEGGRGREEPGSTRCRRCEAGRHRDPTAVNGSLQLEAEQCRMS
jgi:hypothetical protein